MKINNLIFILTIGLLGISAFVKTPYLYSQTDEPLAITIDTVIATDFSNPVQVTHADDGSGRLFVVEQRSGLIKIIEQGQVLASPFLDVSDHIRASGNEQGLLGIAFHPDYSNNGYFYLNYTNSNGDTEITRYQISTNDSNIADPESAQLILTIPQPFSNHNGGQLLFGPDGYLYIGMGDGGSGGDPQNHGQNNETLLGAMLRLDVTNQTTYTIPADNPYINQTGADEIWAIGLRNPWRFSFDRVTGDLYIADVGQGAWEEVSYQPANSTGGLNYGWNCREGAQAYAGGDCSLNNYVDPIAEYGHDVGFSITGGFVYRGQQYRALQGYYFYADYVTGRIWAIKQMADDSWSVPQEILQTTLNISAFGEDEAGELYMVDHTNGTIRQLQHMEQATSTSSPTNSPTATSMATTTVTITPVMEVRGYIPFILKN